MFFFATDRADGAGGGIGYALEFHWVGG